MTHLEGLGHEELNADKNIRSEKAEYEENYEFWTEKGDKLTVMGDFLGRLPSAELLKAKKDEKILDAGCGAGFMSRIYARQGAEVTGCDRAGEMLRQAETEEEKTKLGIQFVQGDITELPFEGEKFDAVSCVAVLIHDSPEECQKFFDESFRVLKPGGRIIVSIMHPYLYQPESPNRNEKASWAQYRQLEDTPLSESQRFEERYRSSEGKEFVSTVWYHPENLFPEQLRKSGFCVLHTQSTYVTPESLQDCNQTGEIGYPAFYQVLARKLEDNSETQ
jgi:ubiquinone/menaquinone biosynthesis C-methylase UbiE